MYFYYRLRVAAERLHHQGEMSGPRRGILLSLKQAGPQTVPHMARLRSVSRQHIQGLVNDLEAEGFVRFSTNPAHKRSQLIELTELGASFVKSMIDRERRIHELVDLGVTPEELRVATDILRRVRAAIETEHWERAADTVA